MNFKKAKATIRAYMQAHYTDERLCALLAHARDGKLAYRSCCCFIGVATADHALREEEDDRGLHYLTARAFTGGGAADYAYAWIGRPDDDARRRRILIPMILAELRRRERTVRERQEAVMCA